ARATSAACTAGSTGARRVRAGVTGTGVDRRAGAALADAAGARHAVRSRRVVAQPARRIAGPGEVAGVGSHADDRSSDADARLAGVALRAGVIVAARSTVERRDGADRGAVARARVARVAGAGDGRSVRADAGACAGLAVGAGVAVVAGRAGQRRDGARRGA